MEFVISGLSGKFPESNNLEEFWDHLIQGHDMVSEDNRRWDIDAFKMPRRMGKIPELDKFDADFFGVPGKQAHIMDPRTRMFLEVTYEAIMDAGVNPKSIQGSRTGVFVCGTLSEAYDIWARSSENPSVQLMPGNYPCMLANRLSYAFNFRGPSIAVETGCSSSFVALNDAILALNSGQCDAAIVGGASVNLAPSLSLAMSKYNMLSWEGKCKTFDSDCGGYVRSEAIVVLYICRKDVAKRNYATIAGVRSNSDGYKEEGPSYPSKLTQAVLLRELYTEAGVNPLDVNYIEAHGTGTKAGDPQEIQALADVFCKGRAGPLLVGSVKTNMGHAECASGLCGIAKVLLSRQAGVIPANLHFQNPNPECTPILNGQIEVIAQPTLFDSKYVGISSFGFGGSNTHVLLKFPDDGPQNSQLSHSNCTIPKVIFASGRTQHAVQLYLEKAVKLSNDPYFLALLHEISKTDSPRQLFHGYAVVKDGKPEIKIEEKNPKTSVWFVYTGLGSQWLGMGQDMMKFGVFRLSMNKSIECLQNNGFDLKTPLETQDLEVLNDLKNALVSITAIQVALTDLLGSLSMSADGIIGHSNGECACAYADHCFTHEQTLLASLAKARSFLETKLEPGTLASIGLPLEEIQCKLPSNIYPAIYNTQTNITVAGPPDEIASFVKEIKVQGNFAKEVKTAMFGFHSPYVQQVKPLITKLIQDVVPEPRIRSSKWLSTSIPASHWDSDAAKLCSAEYHANNAISPVYLYQTLQHVPEGSVVLEIGPHCFLQSILKESLGDKGVPLGLMSCKCDNNVTYFLESMGKLFLRGKTVDIGKLYDKVQFPVSGRVPSVSPLIQWDHSTSWDVPNYREELSSGKGTKYSMNPSTVEYLSGHVLQGKIVFPATGYLWLVWKALAKQRNIPFEKLAVRFENVHFQRQTELLQNDDVNFTVTILGETGHFQVTESDEVVCQGVIQHLPEGESKNRMFDLYPQPRILEEKTLEKEAFYKILNLRGYEYQGIFQGIFQLHSDWAELEWNENWVSFLDTFLQAQLPKIKVKGLSVPIRIAEAIFDPQEFIGEILQNPGLVTVQMCKILDVTQCPGIKFRGIKFSGISSVQTAPASQPTLFEQKFSPYFDSPSEYPASNSKSIMEFFLGIAVDNSFGKEFFLTEILSSGPPNFTESSLKSVGASTVEFLQHRVLNLSNFQPETNEGTLIQHFSCIENLKNLKSPSHFIVTDSEELVLKHQDLLKDKAFLMILNASAELDLSPGFVLISQKYTEFSSFALFRHSPDRQIQTTVVSIDVPDYGWIETLQSKLEDANNERIVIWSAAINSGINGLTKCLIKEPGGHRIRSFQIFGPSSMNYDDISNSELIADQIQRDLVFNTYQGGSWGCFTNQSVPLSDLETPRSIAHAYADIQNVGDLSSLCWIQSPCNLQPKNLIEIHYSALNFKDVMHATGKLSKSTLPEQLHRESCILGFEFSGTFGNKRICGLAPNKCLATALEGKPSMVWDIPEEWSLEEAATIPAVYATALYGLIVKGRMRPEESVLIHSGSGGVGLAAITIALSMGCKVFTTVGSAQKREFLKERFPELKDSQISDSRNALRFEQDVLIGTHGKGVNLVLNSLAQEKLQASVRCLAMNGRFIEIGKFDVLNNSALGMEILLKQVQIQGIYLDYLMVSDIEEKQELVDLMKEFIGRGYVKPLPFTSFESHDLEGAFRYLASGRHLGKVLVKVKNSLSEIKAVPRTYFYPEKTYVIIGGLGGMGLEVIDWMVERGARELFIISRSGPRNSYQKYMVEKWRELGANVYLESIDVSCMKEACQMLLNVISIGPIGGIFNLALVLEDALFENQSPEKFETVAKGKILATLNFDSLSRQLAPNIDHFVVFSSVVANRGNPGQSNYGFANSVMERVCEKRKSDGLPALAIQWGLVGDVGYTADMFKGKSAIMGMEPQTIGSCIYTLDLLLQQERTVVSSLVTMEDEKERVVNVKEASLADAGARILGIQDLAKVDPNATLNEMGMDSIMATELKQTLHLKRNIVLPSQAYGKLTFKSLLEME